MKRPYIVEELVVDVVRVPAAALQDLADLLEDAANNRTTPAARMLRDLAAEIDDVLFWRAVRGDLLEQDATG
jgi:hypothetical protein